MTSKPAPDTCAAAQPRVFTDLETWRAHRRELKGSIGFVPTMGALHQGHVSLLERSVKENDHTVLSIYVNPTQFNNADDLTNYPATLDQDLKAARDAGVTHVIVPGYDEIYRDGYRYQIDETELSRELCGAHRPGHFTGVLTVVMKLLNIARADRAYFGEKDYQQYMLIRDMADAFFMDVEIVGCETIRETDGLALSSRNAHLNEQARRLAPRLNALLTSCASDEQIANRLTCSGFDVDYIVSKHGRRFAAASLTCDGHLVRLIDNVKLP